MKKLISMLLICILTLSLSGCNYFMPKEDNPPPPPLVKPESVHYTTTKIKLGTVDETENTTGTFISAEMKNLTFANQSGNISSINCKLGGMVKKGELIASLDISALNLQIKNQKLQVESAQLDLNACLAGSLDYQKAQLALEQQQNDLESLNTQLANSQLYASFTGQVTYVASINPGDYVDSSILIATISDTSQVELTCTNDENNSFKTGMSVTIAYSKENYIGKVYPSPFIASIFFNFQLICICSNRIC